jgi:hypothetical protein
MRLTNIKVGDCFVIPLPDGRHAYGQYLLWDDRNPGGLGCLIKVFDLITDEKVSVEDLARLPRMFPPVYVGLKASIRSGRWRVIGQLPVEDARIPTFRRTIGSKPGIYHDWKIGDGQNWQPIGDLPPDLRSLEMWLVWSDESLEKRIVTGRNLFGENRV